MYRLRAVCIVQYGKFREFAGLAKRISDVCEAKGWAKPRLLVPTAGANNEAVLEFEYPDLATLEAENRSQMTDPEFMGPYRESAAYIYPQTARTEIYEDAFDIA
ncbi:MAG: hypothetical protein HOQ07_06860 [Sinomonas sp.]|nr:hypothetical protein [Sinomonas sp.]